ncbi:hypothetical protein F2Q70_00026978 [Brassica cretica]|uniref:Uncharacterized protein n=1 Tax=Brassica cretica TaxID=69181 RepID=A0A8S9L7P1_BRACR|nr:hypothetical protein F2Q70_00026978 [Brassica cretica]
MAAVLMVLFPYHGPFLVLDPTQTNTQSQGSRARRRQGLELAVDVEGFMRDGGARASPATPDLKNLGSRDGRGSSWWWC